MSRLPSGKICLADRKSETKPEAGEWYVGRVVHKTKNVAFADLEGRAPYEREILLTENKIRRRVRYNGHGYNKEDLEKFGSERVESELRYENPRIVERGPWGRTPLLKVDAILSFEGSAEEMSRAFHDPEDLPEELRRSHPEAAERFAKRVGEMRLFNAITLANAKIQLRRLDRRAYRKLCRLPAGDAPVALGQSSDGMAVRCEEKVIFLRGRSDAMSRVLAKGASEALVRRRLCETAVSGKTLIGWCRRFAGLRLPARSTILDLIPAPRHFKSREEALGSTGGGRVNMEIEVEVPGDVTLAATLRRALLKRGRTMGDGGGYELRWLATRISLRGELELPEYVREGIVAYYASLAPQIEKRGLTYASVGSGTGATLSEGVEASGVELRVDGERIERTSPRFAFGL
jgi:hypothetical protein